jgi:2'-5' RNA ligase
LRLFAAIDLDDAARATIAAIQHRLAKQLDPAPSLTWVRPSHVHLTLVFVGEVADDRLPPIAASLALDFELSPFVVMFQTLGVFPARGAPSVLWLGVTEGEDKVRDLQRQVAGRLARLGVTLKRREFHPHLTLARWRHATPADRLRVSSLDTRSDGVVLDVREVALYQSQLSRAGSTYTPLARATLK